MCVCVCDHNIHIVCVSCPQGVFNFWALVSPPSLDQQRVFFRRFFRIQRIQLSTNETTSGSWKKGAQWRIISCGLIFSKDNTDKNNHPTFDNIYIYMCVFDHMYAYIYIPTYYVTYIICSFTYTIYSFTYWLVRHSPINRESSPSPRNHRFSVSSGQAIDCLSGIRNMPPSKWSIRHSS